MNIREKIGSRIRELREQKNMSQSDLAIKAELSQSTIAKIEGGKWSASLDLLDKITRALNCEIRIEVAE